MRPRRKDELITTQENSEKQEQSDYITPEQAERLAKNALMHSNFDDPDEFVRALLPILDNTTDARARDAIGFLIDGAFARGLAFSIALRDYVEAIRRGGKPTKEWQVRKYGNPDDAKEAKQSMSEPAHTTGLTKCIRTNRIEIVDEQGRVRVTLAVTPGSGPALYLIDETGEGRLQIDLVDGDDPIIALYDRPSDNPAVEIDTKGLRHRDRQGAERRRRS